MSEQLLARLLAGEVVREFSSRLRCKDGSVRAVLIDSSGYRENGRFIHTRCITRDVTDQLRSEEDLQRDQARLRLATQATQDLIWDWDLVKGQVVWEGATEAFFPERPVELGVLAGADYRLWADRVHPDDL